MDYGKLISETMEKLTSKNQYCTVHTSLFPDFDINSINEAVAFVGSIKNDEKYCNSKYNKDFEYCLLHFLDKKRREPFFNSNRCIKLFIEQLINSNDLKIQEYSEVNSSPLSDEGLKKRASKALKHVIEYGHFLLSNLERIKTIIALLPQIEKGEQFEALEQSEISQQSYIPKPCFKLESIEDIKTTLNTFFDTSQHAELKRLIETGSNTQTKILFRDSGNKLSDYFKGLFEADIITGCSKKELINWIVKNFKYTYRTGEKNYTYKTVEKTISGNQNPCKNPIR